MNAIKLADNKRLKAIILAAFPDYRKREAFVSEFRPMNVNSYWDGGSREEYAIVELATSKRLPLPKATHPVFEVAGRGGAGYSDPIIEVDRVGNITLKVLPVGFCLVQAGMFLGKPATAHVYTARENRLEEGR